MIPEQNRSMDALSPLFRPHIERWLAAVRKAGLSVQVYETHRTRARQAYLYSLGRTRPGAIVTYTLDSAHLYGLAVDMMVLRGKQADWSWGAYSGVYRHVPVAPFGLELLSFERPHCQLAGIQGPGQRNTPSIFAARNGIQAGVIVGSKWPVGGK